MVTVKFKCEVFILVVYDTTIPTLMINNILTR